MDRCKCRETRGATTETIAHQRKGAVKFVKHNVMVSIEFMKDNVTGSVQFVQDKADKFTKGTKRNTCKNR